MGIGILLMPESARSVVHKGKHLEIEAFKVWKRIRGIRAHEPHEEFFLMKISTEKAEAEVISDRPSAYLWMDFLTKLRTRLAITYAGIMIFLDQLTGINAIMYYMSAIVMLPGFADLVFIIGVSYPISSLGVTLKVYLLGLIIYEMLFGSYACPT
ncbi:hypothetical protein CC78DRAFT_586484 [Lojkania enalia]|uniref:Uncharacterized protein n=1 Tax=Lojkania enalia TaxID=147567 RepID=A0A9P4K3V0_9PLEO|nr:hypothetical protein CC78DRAFT_586484 [Didymosphaeria enalia]